MVDCLSNHEKYMKRALELAKKGSGKTNPNPLVGAVIVKNETVIAEGFHEVLGGAHAEVAAMQSATQDVKDSTLYVNLEPCSHFGRTPPCAKAVIDAGIKEVVIGMVDPNPKVSGQGIKMLQDAGITTTVGILEEECKKLNEIFIKYIVTKRPFTILKTAMTLDGKIASATGDSKWISGEKSRLYVHHIRNRVSAVMVGITTVLKDNPFLTTRLESGPGRDAARIIVDSKGVLPLDSNVINPKSNAKVFLATTSAINPLKEKQLEEKGVHIIKADGISGQVDLIKLMNELYKMEMDSVLLEGGGTLNASALQSGIVDKLMFFIAPKVIGGKDAVTPVEGCGIHLMKDAVGIKDMNVLRFDEDILIEGYL
ncbi:MAG: bifunctional diaminohydroxyphosphoribosylaminopyrimidine deaminase/5-amino-6-(5-phosphoribosylamino)uracil reductase RibD [Clostridia bacterium]|nr:bifunctional diaminohydroxyphosphoribosylaminopyrimidine deaminase/5-amino-6-(5-phosphoribosylamino)uracil reductase RibD [Clostridia bacterium]